MAGLNSTAYAQSPTVQPTYAEDYYATDPSYAVGQVLQGFAPQAAYQDNNLNNELSSMGVEGGPAVDAQTALSAEQTGALAPTLGSVYSQYAGNSLQQALANAGFANSASSQNAGNTLGANEFNAGSFNSVQDLIRQLQQEAYSQQAGQVGGLQAQGVANAAGLGEQQAGEYPVYNFDSSALGGGFGGGGGGGGGGDQVPPYEQDPYGQGPGAYAGDGSNYGYG